MNFDDFKKIVVDDIETDKNDLNIFLTKWLQKLPIPKVDVNQNAFIERAVLISKDNGKFNIDRLSYIPKNLKHKVKEGRFNNAHEPMFYAAFTDLETPEATRYFLATELDHTLQNKQDKSFNFTITKWLSTVGFPSIFLLFKKDYCTNELTNKALEQIKSSVEFNKLTNRDIEFFELLTDEIAKPHSANKYSITNIVFDFYKNEGYKSIIYPGVRSKFRGNNIAISPQIIDKNWVCCFGAEFNLTQKGDNIKIKDVYKIRLIQDELVYSEFEESEFGGNTRIDK